ncbi:MAG: HD-GYP domain-containing protein [Dissulfuribacterales bacterium]
MNDLELASACAAEIAIAVENYELLQAVKQAFKDFASDMVKTMEAKHPITAGHSQRVTTYTMFLAEKMGFGFQDMELCNYACLLHDIGKIAIPDSILTKPNRFSNEERKIMESHALWTKRILEEVKLPRELEALPIVASSHHERLNGSGYPFGLSGNEIPLPARIMAITDVFDALTSRRDYPKYDEQHTGNADPFDLERVFHILQKGEGIHFDADICELFYTNRKGLEVLMRKLHETPKQG